MSRLSHVYVQYLLVFPGSALDHLYFDTTSSLRLVSERRLSIVLFHGLCPLPMLLVFYPVYSCFSLRFHFFFIIFSVFYRH